MRLTVIIPVHNGAAHLGRCLEAIYASSRLPEAVIVVDDDSRDDSAAIASGLGADVLRLPHGPHGPAVARNRAAEAAQGDILVFVDADVAVHPDTMGRIERYFTEHAEVQALFGSYDADPPERGLVTRYKNLLHHYVHQHGTREASTFWAGCGAVRRPVFCGSGGFDESYTSPSIEDIELGSRLHRAGHRIWLCPDVQAAHLKHWTFLSWLRADIFGRAVPWTRLIVQNASLPNTLNLTLQSRLSALCAWGLLLFLVGGFLSPWAWLGLLPALSGLIACNAGLLRFFRKHGGIGFAGGASALHLLYYLYSSLTYVLIAGAPKLARHGLALLLLATLCKGLLWGVAIPPWQSNDEPQHFLYGQSIERLHTLRVPASYRVPGEVWELARLAQMDSVRADPARPLRIPNRQELAASLAVLNRPDIRHDERPDTDLKIIVNPNFYRYHPPLYYTLLAAIQGPLEGRNIQVRLMACRCLSILLGLGVVAVSYAAGRVLWPERPAKALLLATLVSFHPMVTFTTSVVTNGALEILLFSAFLLVSLRVIRDGLTVRWASALGLLTGLGLLTKMSFLSVLPLLVLLLVWDIARQRREGHLRRLALSLRLSPVLLPLLLCGWWYRDTIHSGGNSLAASYGQINGHDHTTLLHYLRHYPWRDTFSLLRATYWSLFGWFGPRLPNHLLTVLSLLTGLCVIGTGAWLIRNRRFDVSFLGAATVFLTLFYQAIDFRLAQQLGGGFVQRGQYYLPPILGQMTWLIVGSVRFIPQRLHTLGLCLVGAGMIALNLYALFGVVLPRYYGSGSFSLVLARAAVLPMVSPTALDVLGVFFLLLCSALMIALWAGLHQDGLHGERCKD